MEATAGHVKLLRCIGTIVGYVQLSSKIHIVGCNHFSRSRSYRSFECSWKGLTVVAPAAGTPVAQRCLISLGLVSLISHCKYTTGHLNMHFVFSDHFPSRSSLPCWKSRCSDHVTQTALKVPIVHAIK